MSLKQHTHTHTEAVYLYLKVCYLCLCHVCVCVHTRVHAKEKWTVAGGMLSFFISAIIKCLSECVIIVGSVHVLGRASALDTPQELRALLT